MEVVTGNLLEMASNGDFDIILHGCNCYCTMGAGIALEIKNTFKEAFLADLKTPKGDPKKLGKISYALVERNGHKFMVVNCYTQFHYKGGNGRRVSYEALRSCLRKVKETFHGKRIAYPKIGAGLAGGDWKFIKKMIDEEFKDEKHTLVLLEKKKSEKVEVV